jgi:hypothetical protein
MSRTATATLNYQLTAFAQGQMNDLAAAMELAERLAPTVVVPGGSGQYKVFDDLNSFQIYNTARALGGDAQRIEFAASDAFYNTKPQALEVTVDQEEREKAGSDNAIAMQLLDEGKIKALLNSTSLAHVKKVTDFVLASLVPVDGRGNFSNEDIDTIDQLDEQIDALAQAVGSTQNLKVTMSVDAWRAIRSNANVKKRVLGAQATPLTRQQLVDSLVIPVDLGIYSISYNNAKLGQAKDKKRVLKGEIIIHSSMPSPTQYDPSPFKVFTGDRSRVTAVRTYRDPSDRFDVHAVDWSEDIKLTSALSALRISLS